MIIGKLYKLGIAYVKPIFYNAVYQKNQNKQIYLNKNNQNYLNNVITYIHNNDIVLVVDILEFEPYRVLKILTNSGIVGYCRIIETDNWQLVEAI